MTVNRNRLIVYGLALGLVLSGFVLGRMTRSDKAEAFNSGAVAVASPTPTAVAGSETAGEASSFYLSDYKTGYTDGFQAGATGQGNGLATTTREGYNEGFKKGFADGYQSSASPTNTSAPAAPVVVQGAPARRVAYRTVERSRPVFVERKRNSTLKTVLTIAAPAAIGAGVGGAVGGKKGAGVGALLGGGGGALYHLIKNR